MTIEKIVQYTIGYKPTLVKKNEVFFEPLPDDKSIRINYLGMERDFEVEFGEWFPIEWKDEEEEDTYEPFTTKDLMLFFPSFVDVNICIECEGKGHYMVYQECTKPASDCCGACERVVQCDCSKHTKLFPYE